MNVISNNIANSTTAGFKGQETQESTFGDHLVSRLSSLEGVTDPNIGPGSYMTVNSSEYTDYTQGSMESTGRNVDMAINGEGFFLVDTETYGPVLTRNGQFAIDADGELTLPGVGKVLNDGEDTIALDSSDFTVSTSGAITVNGEEVDTLYVVKPSEGATMKSVGNGAYQCDSYEQTDTANYAVYQGRIEKSNVNLAQEMSRLIAGQNHYNSCAQILKIYDNINNLTVNQIGKLV